MTHSIAVRRRIRNTFKISLDRLGPEDVQLSHSNEIEETEMKIKCVSNIGYDGYVSGYLTLDKHYECVIDEDGQFAIIDDEGDLLNDFLHDPCHGKYEVVHD